MKTQRLIVVAAAVVLALSVGAQAGWFTVADWQFNGDATQWLKDSANGYDLTVIGGVAQDGGGTTAVFTGGLLWTNGNTIDLTGYRQVRVSWSMKVLPPDIFGIIWEHGTATANVGTLAAFAGYPPSHPAARDDAALLNGTNGDLLPFSWDTWETLVVEYDLDATAANVVRVWIGGVEQADSIAFGYHNLPGAGYSLLNNNMHIGARSGGSHQFQGEIDYLTIEAVPEPATMALLLSGSVLTIFRRRKK